MDWPFQRLFAFKFGHHLSQHGRVFASRGRDTSGRQGQMLLPRRSLREIIPTVDMNELADEVTSIVCGEKHDDVCDVFGLGQLTCR